jgi:hypothetical protein
MLESKHLRGLGIPERYDLLWEWRDEENDNETIM